MLGAIIGDIIGSTYEFHNTRDYDFELFPQDSSFTDDTVCTVAIADAILRGIPYKDSLIEWCRKYPNPKGAYGVSFSRWIWQDDPQPYDSFGNGAAMRVSPIGWAFNKSTTALDEAKKSAECSHSHDEGIKGAMATALATWYLSHHHWKDAKMEVQNMCVELYGKDYVSNLPKIGEWNETCQGCVPLALHLFSLSQDFEDAIRLAISYGGDSDTIGAIVGSLAGAFYEIPKTLISTTLDYLPDEMIKVVREFDERFGIDDFYITLN